jgi:hypothetical protein
MGILFHAYPLIMVAVFSSMLPDPHLPSVAKIDDE